MTWWAWTLVFLAILGGGAWFVWTRVRATLRSFRGLTAQIRTTEALVAEVTARAEAVSAPATPHLAIFTAPHLALAEQRAVRERVKRERHARREPKLAPWARRALGVDGPLRVDESQPPSTPVAQGTPRHG